MFSSGFLKVYKTLQDDGPRLYVLEVGAITEEKLPNIWPWNSGDNDGIRQYFPEKTEDWPLFAKLPGVS